jgi:hypothetical protein
MYQQDYVIWDGGALCSSAIKLIMPAHQQDYVIWDGGAVKPIMSVHEQEKEKPIMPAHQQEKEKPISKR